MRTLRKVLQAGFPIAGMVVVFAAIILIGPEQQQAQIIVALLGILMIEAGVWKLTNPFLPSERTYTELREEVDSFIGLVRQINQAAIDARASGDREDWQLFRGVKQEMHNSVDRMAGMAGKEFGERPTVPPERADPDEEGAAG